MKSQRSHHPLITLHLLLHKLQSSLSNSPLNSTLKTQTMTWVQRKMLINEQTRPSYNSHLERSNR
ncbi:hypothetical protein KC19_11G132400 [Ceratodon purpureus]|uniref:Uncharacterized protein n=1 Tax=Ceratodon purpureus TaxID=3225 RepID=A0A8T0GK43_CERPU|nr:hypothetical protein KC19_11G132400 [Ceratodon purpureus]